MLDHIFDKDILYNQLRIKRYVLLYLAMGNKRGAVMELAGAIPGGKVFRYSTHAMKQKANRKITNEMVAHTIGHGVKFRYIHDGAKKVGYYHKDTRILVTMRGRKITTVMKSRPKYINSLLKKRY